MPDRSSEERDGAVAIRGELDSDIRNHDGSTRMGRSVDFSSGIKKDSSIFPGCDRSKLFQNLRRWHLHDLGKSDDGPEQRDFTDCSEVTSDGLTVSTCVCDFNRWAIDV